MNRTLEEDDYEHATDAKDDLKNQQVRPEQLTSGWRIAAGNDSSASVASLLNTCSRLNVAGFRRGGNVATIAAIAQRRLAPEAEGTRGPASVGGSPCPPPIRAREDRPAMPRMPRRATKYVFFLSMCAAPKTTFVRRLAQLHSVSASVICDSCDTSFKPCTIGPNGLRPIVFREQAWSLDCLKFTS